VSSDLLTTISKSAPDAGTENNHAMTVSNASALTIASRSLARTRGTLMLWLPQL
jgi:hypothetical protein